jgi:hypothetical protein
MKDLGAEVSHASTLEIGLGVGPGAPGSPGSASVTVFAAMGKILSKHHGERAVDQAQLNGMISRVADLEAYWCDLPKVDRKGKAARSKQ